MMKVLGLALAVSVAALTAVAAIVLPGPAQTADAAIHEIVASHCSAPKEGGDPADKGEGHAGQTNPPGLVRFGKQSFVRPLFATGVYADIVFGADPDGNPGDFITVVMDTDKPASKVSWDGVTYEAFFDEELGATIFFPAIEPDHASLEHCANFGP